YVAQMRLVQRDYEANNIGHAGELLENWVPRDETDRQLRGFEWYYWHLRTHRELLTLKGGTWGVCYSPDGTRLAAFSEGAVKVWDSTSGQDLLTLKGPFRNLYSICFSPDGKRLATADLHVKVWDSTSGQQLLTLQKGEGVLASELRGRCVCFSPDGTRLATGVYENQLIVWDSESGREVLSIHIPGVRFVCFSPDGTRLATACDDGTVTLWDSSSGQRLLALKGLGNSSVHGGNLCFSPDSTRLALAGGGQVDYSQLVKPGEVKVWDSTSGQEILAIKDNAGPVVSLCFSPDGRRLASGSN